MKWTIEPIKGKYYGTVVRNIETNELIVVWFPFGKTLVVSSRELDDGWTEDYGFDHVESERSYKAATIICKALNKELE